MHDQLPRFSILGAGALGSLYACKLRQSAWPVELLLRPQSFVRKQISLELVENDQLTTLELPCSSVEEPQPIQWLVVTTKAYQAVDAVLSVKHRFDQKTRLLLLHNGLGSFEALKGQLGATPILLGTSTHGALKPSANRLIHTGFGDTHLGLVQGELSASEAETLTDVISDALPPCHWQRDIWQPLWIKLAINCVINPLTAIHQCRNGDLARPEFQAEIDDLTAEFSMVANHCGQSFDTRKLRQQVEAVIEKTAANFSSMNRDVAEQRKTEIEQITGYLLSKASEHQLSVPRHSALYQKIGVIESSYLGRT